MPSNQAHFQPPHPIRTSTSDSTKSHSSDAMSPGSDMGSPVSGFPRGAASPTEESFGAIASRIRRGRSRSRSRADASRKRSKSPMVMPPEHLPPRTAQPASERPKQSRHTSRASQSSTHPPVKPSRPSLQDSSRRSTSSSSNMWTGRHANSWLFNDFSVTDTAKGILHIGRKS
ncbi:hypothetical protein BS50DRAFT_630251 [Corynespora cassiicola Philippines]|uniref:Uncharacterized protein n=1 Tax=Corynespora cassiicola Philippines TaxID=1448308 RepID=A0A2T2P3C0_CORCC|nr:hypothetical protein BS50DRAFT_630251 [Corynespora cassiicola Philippines]